MAHGGLARAGKVRMNTPKVQVCDERQRVTGRAKLRRKVNKRLNEQTLGASPNKNGGNGCHYIK